MSQKPTIKLQEHLFLFLKAESGNPIAVRLEMRKIYLLASLILGIFFCFFSGTVLFFRELEMNRKLEDRLLVLDTREKLRIPSAPTQTNPVSQSITSFIEPAIQQKVEQKVERKLTETPPIAKTEPEIAGPVSARLSDFTVDWNGETCTAHISLVPTTTGMAEGDLLLILETEIPRIGGSNPSSQIRKRYFIYPGYQSRDELDESQISQIDRKPFHFSRALQTSATFNVGKLLRPIALNVYVFDSNKTLIHHERKPIETDESYGN